MKNITRSILLLFAAFAASAVYAGRPAPPSAPGVAGVDVFVKQSPSQRAVTDARGIFALNALPPGSYTLAFRSRSAGNTKTKIKDKVTVASTYSIRVEGTTRSVKQGGLTSDSLIAGVDVPVQVGPGAKVRGQVLAGAMKRMVWIPREPGSHIPGYWAEEGSAAASKSNTVVHSGDDLRDQMNRNPNMSDPFRNAPRQGIPSGGQ